MKKNIVVTAIAIASSIGTALVGSTMPAAHAQDTSPVREVEIVVRGGFSPSRVEVREGERVRLRFVRLEYTSCAREIVLPSLGIRRELPPHRPVVVDLPLLAAGEYELRCGINMARATIVVGAAE